MQLSRFLQAFNSEGALNKLKLLPLATPVTVSPITCGNCCFVNQPDYKFCTDCGYPIHPDRESLERYFFNRQKVTMMLHNCSVKIEHARNALYVVATCSMLGIFSVFSHVRQTVVTGLVMVLLGIIYAGLGRWSLTRPFTSLLISLIVMVTFTVINTWAELSSMFKNAGNFYLLVIQIILIHFLLQGVKGAFRADVLEEQFKE